MNVHEAVQKRRSYRHLEKTELTGRDLDLLIQAARLAPSCFNNQPWRYIFITDQDKLREMHNVYSGGNEWIHGASLVIAVFSRKDDDCVVGSRDYYQFDTGLSVGQVLLQATELGLTAHPVAGFSPKKTREILNIPEEYDIITLIIVGKKAVGSPDEPPRPRKPVNEIIFNNRYNSI